MTIAAEHNILYQTVRKLSAILSVNTRVAPSMRGVETHWLTARVTDVSITAPNQKVCPSLLIKTIWMCITEKNLNSGWKLFWVCYNYVYQVFSGFHHLNIKM